MFLNVNATLCTPKSATPCTARNVIPSTPRSATLSTSKSVRRSITLNNADKFLPKNAVTSPRRNAEMFQRRSAARFPRRNVPMSRRGSVRLSRGRSARMFQEPSALSLHPGSVAPSPDSNAEMFLNSNVARFPRWIVRCSTANIVRRFPPRTAAPELSVSVPWFPAFVPRRSMSSNVPLSITRNVAQSPDR